MKLELLTIIRCPESGARLKANITEEKDGEIYSGELFTDDGVHRYQIRESIPRFVPDDNYARSFGMQWNQFRHTQLDSVSGLPISESRFFQFSEWTREELKGRRVLDVGCGAGRFTQIALQTGATVFAMDYSAAVDACRANLAPNDRLHIVQADIFAIPFAPAQFDYVYCFGVLQHTPDVETAFRALPKQLKPGGKLAVDLYPWLFRNALWSKYWIRPITKRLKAHTLFHAVRATTPLLLAVSRKVSRLPVLGNVLRYLIPVVNYEGIYDLTENQLLEWATLDTFDMLAPAHDHPQTRRTLARWLTDAGLAEISIERLGFLVGRGKKPRAE